LKLTPEQAINYVRELNHEKILAEEEEKEINRHKKRREAFYAAWNVGNN